MHAQTLKLLTWNVNGFGHKIKGWLVTRAINRYKAEVIFLQETHLVDKQQESLGRGRYKVVGHAHFSSGSRRVLILVKKSLPFHVVKTWGDKNGCYTAVQGEWEGEVMILINVYMPLGLQSKVLDEIGRLLVEMPNALTIIGGDVNLVWQTDMDRTSTRPESAATQGKLENFANALCLGDVWREFHPGEKAYSFYSGAQYVLDIR